MIKRWTIALALFVSQALAAAASACPSCKDTVTQAAGPGGGPGGPTPGLPSGFNVSVYLMLVGLFCVMGLVGGIIIKGIRSTNNPAAGRGFPVK